MMSFLASILHFIVVFFFTLGAMNLVSSVLAVTFLRDEIPSIKIMLIQNLVSAFLISISFTITVNFLPVLYKEARINSGVIKLYTKDWNENINIVSKNDMVDFLLCGKKYSVKNNMYAFYEKLNNSLLNCSIKKGTKVNIEVVVNPFKNIDEMSTNSILRKHFY